MTDQQLDDIINGTEAGDNRELAIQLKQARDALKPFVGYFGFVEAVHELSQGADPKPLEDHACVASMMAGGGGDYLWAADFRKARSVFDEQPPDETSTAQFCNQIAELPAPLRWKIIEGLMLKSLIDTHADHKIVTGRTDKQVEWTLMATRDPLLAVAIQKLVEGYQKE